MREYAKVYTAFWSDPSMRSLTEDARTLALYLLTCPHGNLIGLFRLPDAYAADDLQWPIERVAKGFSELFAKGFCNREKDSAWLVIPKFVRWNQFENPNVAKNASKAFEAAPHGEAKTLCANSILEYGKHIDEAFRKALETLSDSVRKPEPSLAKPEPSQKESATASPPRSPQARRLPENWQPDEEAWRKAVQTLGRDLAARELEKFRNHWTSKTERRLDWGATWRNWVMKAEDYAKTRGNSGPGRESAVDRVRRLNAANLADSDTDLDSLDGDLRPQVDERLRRDTDGAVVEGDFRVVVGGA